ncbi:hypothetical protein [Enterobacter soli]
MESTFRVRTPFGALGMQDSISNIRLICDWLTWTISCSPVLLAP